MSSHQPMGHIGDVRRTPIYGTSPCASIRIRLGCGRCPALRPGELQHKLHAKPDQCTHDDHDRRVGDGLCGRRGTQVVARGPYKGKAPAGRSHRAEHRDRQRQDQTGHRGGVDLCGPPTRRGAGEDSIRRVADSGQRPDRRQPQQKAPSIDSAITQIGTATTALASTLTQNCPGS